MFQSEAAIDDACDQDRVLREHFLQAARSHPEKVLPPELVEILELRELGVDEPEDETETPRALSEREREREKRELFSQHRNLEHPQPTELARHCDAAVSNM